MSTTLYPQQALEQIAVSSSPDNSQWYIDILPTTAATTFSSAEACALILAALHDSTSYRGFQVATSRSIIWGAAHFTPPEIELGDALGFTEWLKSHPIFAAETSRM